MNKFLAEIHEQPGALRKTLAYYTDGKGREILERIIMIWQRNKYSRIVFTGMGSSFFVSYAASCLLSQYGIISTAVNAGELIHYHFSQLKTDTLLVCISQSGESFEVVRILEKLPAGIACIGISNEENSTLIKKAAAHLLCKAGKEEMTSTKTYVSTCLVLYIFSLALAGKWDPAQIAGIENAIVQVDSLIKNTDTWLNPALRLLDHCAFIQIVGRGSSYATAQQGALMFMEGARNPSSASLGGEFRHGPMEMVKKGFRAIVFAPRGETYEQSLRLAEDMVKYEGMVILITNSPQEVNNSSVLSIHIPCLDEYLFIIPAIVPLQLIVNEWAMADGNEPGNFTRGAKITTAE
jgi:glucosamine--fructose-6-phosphate aminotransferase (isomerizing)